MVKKISNVDFGASLGIPEETTIVMLAYTATNTNSTST